MARKIALVAMLAWWFHAAGAGTGVTNVGPFQSLADCEKIRQEVKAAGGWASSCWWGIQS